MAVRGNIGGIDSPETLEKALRAAYYLADEGIATAAYLAGGASALLLYRSRNPFPLGALVPRADEIVALIPRARAAIGRLRSLLPAV